MPKWSDFGSLWSTLREVDVGAIREEAERPLRIPCVGHPTALDAIQTLLTSGPQRYGPVSLNPLIMIPVNQTATTSGYERADLLLLAVDARRTLTQADRDGFALLDQIGVPSLVVVLFPTVGGSNLALTYPVTSKAVVIADPNATDAADRLARAILEALPEAVQLAAARALPGLRSQFARDLINTTSVTNATFAIASSVPEAMPILNVPFVAADMLILTKNQALMVYRLALAYGAAPHFQERIAEMIPVVGGGFLWRQMARSLIGLIPVWSAVPKVAVAYAGTYTTGIAAWRWYAEGEMIPQAQIKQITNDAFEQGKLRANELLEKTSQTFEQGKQSASGLIERAGDALEQGKQRASDLLERAGDALEQGKQRASDLLERARTSRQAPADEPESPPKEGLTTRLRTILPRRKKTP